MGVVTTTRAWGGAPEVCEGCHPLARLRLGTNHSWAPSTFATHRHLESPGPEQGDIPESPAGPY